MGWGRRGRAGPPAWVLSEVGRHARAGILGLHNPDGPRGSTLEVMLFAGRTANNSLLSLPRTGSPPPPAFGAWLTSGLDGFRVLGAKGQGHLALGHRLFSCEGLSRAA